MLRPVSQGAFSEVFAIDRSRVLKAFRDCPISTAPHADVRLIPTVSFAAELRAYQRLQALPHLELWVPQFFGDADPREYPLASSESFASGCGLILEYIQGEALKLGEIQQPLLSEVESVLEQMMEQIGVQDPWDGSGFVPGSRAPVTLIDFATPTDELHALDQLAARDSRITMASMRLLDISQVVERWRQGDKPPQGV